MNSAILSQQQSMLLWQHTEILHSRTIIVKYKWNCKQPKKENKVVSCMLAINSLKLFCNLLCLLLFCGIKNKNLPFVAMLNLSDSFSLPWPNPTVLISQVGSKDEHSSDNTKLLELLLLKYILLFSGHHFSHSFPMILILRTKQI